MIRSGVLLLMMLTWAPTLLLAAPPSDRRAVSEAEPAVPIDAPAAGVEADEQRLRTEVAGLLDQLDSNDFATRSHAAARLDALVAMPEHGSLLAAEFQQVLRELNVSFEVRWHLDRWLRHLPELPPEPPGIASPEELKRLVHQLDADAYAVRLAAVRRLEWLLGNGKLVGPVTSCIKARFAEGDLSEAAAKYLDEVWTRLRGVWSQSNPAEWNLPEVTDDAIAGWIDDLVAAGPAGADSRRPSSARTAERELRDLLMRDDDAPRVAAVLKTRLEEATDLGARARLSALLDETRPAMVAEIWQNRQHLVEQHLLVGVPSETVGAPRPSYFDRIDDRTAHCVCGSSLSPGEYPVGVAIPHPRSADILFHLINLPTPRRRLWYLRHALIDETVRVRELSRRTVDRLRSREQPLDEDDLRALAGLDPAEVSRFAAWYLPAVADSPLPPWEPRLDPYAPGQFIPLPPPTYLGGRPSRHGALCLLLAAEGTREAAPGLLAAIEQNRFQPPSEEAPYRLDWIAALAIAQRDPWPEADAWLARAISNQQALRLAAEPADEPAAEIGATAAAILLVRHGQQPIQFGLEPAADEPMAAMGLAGYRFCDPASRQRVLQWHKERARDNDSQLPPNVEIREAAGGEAALP